MTDTSTEVVEMLTAHVEGASYLGEYIPKLLATARALAAERDGLRERVKDLLNVLPDIEAKQHADGYASALDDMEAGFEDALFPSERRARVAVQKRINALREGLNDA